MNQFDVQYKNLIKNIIKNGYCNKNDNPRGKYDSDGAQAYTYSLLSQQFRFDNTQVPLLTTKYVAVMTAIKECPLLFWQKKTNKISDMHDMNVRIWDEWEIKEGEFAGTIGESYGFQLGKISRKVKLTEEILDLLDSGFLSDNNRIDDEGEYIYLDQVDYLLWQLKTNPSSRRHVVSLWNIDDLDNMALNPCVWHTQWLVKEGKLHLIVGVRSNDMALGNPFNVFQYYVLQRMIAQVTGYELGTLTFNINDAHVYERHIEPLAKQILLPDYPAPTLDIDPDIKNFYDFTIDSFKLNDYKHGPTIPMEVAI